MARSAMAVATAMEAKVAPGTMTRQQLIDAMRQIIHPMRFGGGAGCISVTGTNGIVIVRSAAPATEDKPATASDSNGKPLNDLVNEALRDSEEGTVSYLFATEQQPVMACVARFAPWNAASVCGACVSDLDAEMRRTLTRLSLAGGLTLLVTIALGLLVNRDIGAPLGRLRDAMARLAGGDLSVPLPGAGRRDELGAMARAVGVFKDSANRMVALRAEQQQERQHAVAEKRESMTGLAVRFESQVGGVVTAVAAAGADMGEAARKVSGSAEAAAGRAGKPLEAAEQATSNAESVREWRRPVRRSAGRWPGRPQSRAARRRRGSGRTHPWQGWRRRSGSGTWSS